MLKPIMAVEGKCAKAPAALEPPAGACAGAVELRDGLCAERGITQIASLLALLVIPEGERQTSLDRLPRGPSRVSGPALVQALHRVDAVRLFEVEHHDLSFSSERTREGPGALCHHRSGLQPTPARASSSAGDPARFCPYVSGGCP